ncbi:S8/S53 family peptidase [Actinoallomurus iriomotensis]|uniref:Peptidase S8/S53 domain-containing protein n=1 Tax=Actinoallomurus iriomotensis TaxID=478107 RepID=A0A9W6VSF3_9ACTN|nr:S8/S53 family peptidase [Actinoallomurus iriomotensis]GLY83288.1 hypothetical protein Airi02_012180 [Actinoallomurus iriomotensis]
MHRRLRRAAIAVVLTVPLTSASLTAHAATAKQPKSATHSLKLADGSKVRWSDDGTGTLTDKQGRTRTFPVPRSAGRTGLKATLTAPDTAIQARAGSAAYTLGDAKQRIQPMNTGPVKLPASVAADVKRSAKAPKATTAPDADAGVPANEGLTSSLQSYLNAQGVNAVGAFHDAATYLHALPGAGQTITNVSIGDLTDQSMADAGDAYVSQYGPTTVVRNGQRYLDIPSMPLIPTYVADNDAHLDATGSTEGQDPYLGEVLLDFSMMAPLPHDRQRPEATGQGVTDLLGIAPGADYRLVIPKEPSAAGISAALRAAAAQTPRPNVITASLGFGTDGSLGFPSRWLEDDPTIRATLADIVRSGIAVVVSSNDGTRLALPVSVGPDGGSTPTDRTASAAAQTDIDDVTPTTTPSLVKDTGVISAGATTLDDTLSSSDVRGGVYPTTRYNGSTAYSSGFGSRVDLAAPGDNLPAFEHVCSRNCTAQDVSVVLNGGTSASAPMIAAAVADVLQAAKATHQQLTPRQVRDLLVATGRPIAPTPQADQALHMGTQLDVTAAVEKVLSRAVRVTPSAVRMSVAQRQLMPSAYATYFVESTDPAAIDLAGPADAGGRPSGQNTVSPITFGLDLTGDRTGVTYRLQVGDKGVIPASGPSLRVLPGELLAAAGLPATSDDARSVNVTFQAVRAGKVLAAVSRKLTFTANDGTYEQAQAPDAPGAVPLGRPVTVRYDLTGVRGLSSPRLLLSSVGHYTPNAGVDLFRAQWSTPLTEPKGTVTIPASAFAAGGAGLYGVGIEQSGGVYPVYGEFRAIRVGAGAAERPGAPLVGTGRRASAHAVDLTRADGRLAVSWDVTSVPGADGAEIELMAPAPTLYGTLNTTTNQNGSGRDDNGVDHASTLLRPLPSAKGRTTLDLAALNVPTGLQYPVRVLATRHGQPIGQASPTSFVQYRDGDQLSGTVEGFTVSGGRALVSTDEYSSADGTQSYRLDRSSTTPYALKDGTLGAPVAQSTDGDLQQLVIGSDPKTGNALIVHTSFSGKSSPQIDVRNAGTGATVKVTETQSLSGGNGYIEGGTIDPVRHRGAVTTYDPGSGLTRLWPVDMATGTVGTPLVINAKNPGRSFRDVVIDGSTGQAFVATTGTMGPCLQGHAPYGAVRADFDTGEVTPVTTMPLCTAGLLPDGKGDKVYVVVGAAQGFQNTFPVSSWLGMDQKTLAQGAAATTDTRGPVWPAYDAAHHVAVEASLFEKGTEADNNAMSEITVLDPDTGKVLARHAVANLTYSTIAGSNFEFTSRQGLYLDPATRTGWVVNAWGTGLERFTY